MSDGEARRWRHRRQSGTPGGQAVGRQCRCRWGGGEVAVLGDVGTEARCQWRRGELAAAEGL